MISADIALNFYYDCPYGSRYLNEVYFMRNPYRDAADGKWKAEKLFYLNPAIAHLDSIFHVF